MFKKVKDLTEREKDLICYKYGIGGGCNDKCPLYRIAPQRPRLCSCLKLNEKELNKEVEVDD